MEILGTIKHKNLKGEEKEVIAAVKQVIFKKYSMHFFFREISFVMLFILNFVMKIYGINIS